MTPVPPMVQCPLRSVPGVLTSDCGVDGARSRWILGTAGGTSGVAGNNSIERSWCGADGARKRARFCTQTALQAASWAASAPRALQRASSLASGSMLSCAAGSDDSRVRPCQANSSAHASTAPPSRMTAAALAMIFGFHDPLRPSVEHLHGVRLIVLRASEKPAELLARLLLIGGGAS